MRGIFLRPTLSRTLGHWRETYLALISRGRGGSRFPLRLHHSLVIDDKLNILRPGVPGGVPVQFSDNKKAPESELSI